MSYEQKFRSDLKDGELGEDLVAEFLIKKGYKILERRKDNWWDIKVEKIGIENTLEIKTDRWEKFNRITNNMFIEVSCSGKDSGIMVTKADYFIYFYPEWELIYIIKCDELKSYLEKDLTYFGEMEVVVMVVELWLMFVTDLMLKITLKQ